MFSNSFIQALKNDDDRSMDELFEGYWAFVFDAVFKKLGDEEVAQDITQEIFISLWENRKIIDLTGPLTGYLYGAVKYRVINYFRSETRRNGHHAEISYLMNLESSEKTDSKLLLNDLNKEVETALDLLPERMRLVVSMSRQQDRSIREIASELGLSAQTVKNQITAAMKILRESLSYTLLIIFLFC